MKFINKSNLEFTDISSEKYRTYVWDNGATVKIKNPLYLNVSNNGHRVFDLDGISHYVPNGWIHMYFKARKGMPNFVK